MLRILAVTASWILFLSLVVFAQEPVSASQEGESVNCPVTILRFSVGHSFTDRLFGKVTQPTEVNAEIRNDHASLRAKSIDVQFDIIDSLRRTLKDRLYVTVVDRGLGDRSIPPGKKRSFRVEFEYYKMPYDCPNASLGSPCLANVQINRIVFKEGKVWTRGEATKQSDTHDMPAAAKENTKPTSPELSPIAHISQYLKAMGIVIDESKSTPQMVVTNYSRNDQKMGFYIYNFGSLKKAKDRDEVQKYLRSLNDTITVGTFFVDNEQDIGYRYIINSDQSLGKAAFEAIYRTMTQVALEQRPEIRRLLGVQ